MVKRKNLKKKWKKKRRRFKRFIYPVDDGVMCGGLTTRGVEEKGGGHRRAPNE